MEEPTNKQGKRKPHIVVKGGGGGGNIGGLVVWGGIVVVGSLIAAFAVKKRRQASTCDKNCDHEGGSKQGLGLILPTKSATSHLNPCDTNQRSESQVDSYAKDAILVTQDHSDDRQDVDDLAKESIPLSFGCCKSYEFSFPVLDASLSSKAGNGIEQNSADDCMNEIEVIKEEKIVDDVKIIAEGMSKVQTIDAGNDDMVRDETRKLEKVVDSEKITTLETPLIHSAVEMEKEVDTEIADSSTDSDDSEEQKMEVEKEAAIDADQTIVKKIPPTQTCPADGTENSGQNLASAEDTEAMKDGEMVDTSYAVPISSSALNSVKEGHDSKDSSPSKENNEVRNGRDLVNDASKHKISQACSLEKEDEICLDNEEENGHESYTSDTGEDSSEGTETTSAESNSSKIWSVESLDADLKDSAEKITENEGQSVVNSESSDNSKNSSISLKIKKDDLHNWTLKKEVPRLLVDKRRVDMTKWRSWGLSILALLLLFKLLLALHKALFSNLL